MTAVQAFLEDLAKQKPTPADWCYVNNFDDPYQPKALKLPPGKGRELQQDMRALIQHVREAIPKAFESEEYNARREEILNAFNKRREKILEELGQRAQGAGFALQATPFGVLIVPVREGRPMSEAELQQLPDRIREEIQRRREALSEELQQAMKEIRRLERAAQQKLQELDRQVALYIVGGLVEDLVEKYRDLPEVVEHLQAVQKDILENIGLFRTPPAQLAQSAQPAGPGQPGGPPVPLPPGLWAPELPFRKYEVNVLVDNSGQQGAPVVVEMNPSYPNLFGRIEKEMHLGALYTDFTLIKPGSLHRANGGYLVLPVEDLLVNPFSWEGLKRALRSREIQIEEIGERLGFLTTKSLRPQPIPLDVKVVLVGRPLLYYWLYWLDEEFAELFKVKADFDVRMDATEENVRDFVAFLCTLCRKERLKHFDLGGAVKVLEYATRLAEDQQKLSTHFGAIADLVREANFWATQANAPRITAEHVQKALEEKVYRSRLIQDRIQELIARGAGGPARLRAELRGGGGGQRLERGAVRAALGPLGAAGQAGHRGHGLRQPARRGASRRRREREDRGLLRRLQGQGAHGRSGGDHPRQQRAEPAAAGGRRRGRARGEVPHLGGQDRRRGHRDPDGRARGRARPRRAPRRRREPEPPQPPPEPPAESEART